jgi:hypothetical protein
MIIKKRKSLFVLPVLEVSFPVSSLPDIPSNFPPDDFVLNKNSNDFLFAKFLR